MFTFDTTNSIIMKKIALLLILLTPSFLIGQDFVIDSISNKYTKKVVVNVNNKSQKEIYDMAKEWIAENYQANKIAIILDDEEKGKIIFKSNFTTVLFMKPGLIRYTLTLEFKDYRFRYTCTDMAYYSEDSGETLLEDDKTFSKKRTKAEIEAIIEESIKSITDFMIKVEEPIDDW